MFEVIFTGCLIVGAIVIIAAPPASVGLIVGQSLVALSSFTYGAVAISKSV